LGQPSKDRDESLAEAYPEAVQSIKCSSSAVIIIIIIIKADCCKLESDLAEHQVLMDQVNRRGSLLHTQISQERDEPDDDELEHSMSEVDANWKQLSKQLSVKKQLLQETIESTKPLVGCNYQIFLSPLQNFGLLRLSEKDKD
jgi:hypothetical protein